MTVGATGEDLGVPAAAGLVGTGGMSPAELCTADSGTALEAGTADGAALFTDETDCALANWSAAAASR